MDITQTLGAPPRVEVKASRVPSGAQAGSPSGQRLLLSKTDLAFSPDSSMAQRAERSPVRREARARRFPCGCQEGVNSLLAVVTAWAPEPSAAATHILSV